MPELWGQSSQLSAVTVHCLAASNFSRSDLSLVQLQKRHGAQSTDHVPVHGKNFEFVSWMS